MSDQAQGGTPPTDGPGRQVGTASPLSPPEPRAPTTSVGHTGERSYVRLPDAPRPPDPKGRLLPVIMGIIGAGLLALLAARAVGLFEEGNGDAVGGGEPPPEGASPPAPVEPNTPAFQSAIDAELEELAEGRIAYGVPSHMKVGVDSDVVLRIQRGPASGLAQGAGAPVVIERLRVAPLMAAELRGREFDVDPEGRQDQVVPPTGFAEWRWSVIPQGSGEQTLRFFVYVVLRLADGTEEGYQIVEDKAVAVSVNPAYSVANFLSTHLASVVAVLTALFGSGMALTFLNRRRGRRPASSRHRSKRRSKRKRSAVGS